MSYQIFKEFFEKVFYFASMECAKLYLIGGFVRDLLTFDEFYSNDIDFVTASDTDMLANNFSKMFGGEVISFKQFLTAKVKNPKVFSSIEEIDFATFRAETYVKNGDFPKVTKVSDLKRDIQRRDFSINTLAISLENLVKTFDDEKEKVDILLLRKYIVDYLGGLKDLDNKIIRVLHSKSFYDDPTRIFRAYKYRERIGGTFSKETEILIKQALKDGVFKLISKNRIKKEIEKIEKEKNGEQVLKELSL